MGLITQPHTSHNQSIWDITVGYIRKEDGAKKN